MTYATGPRMTRRRAAHRMSHVVATGAQVYTGTMVCLLTASGQAVRAGTANTGRVAGLAMETVLGDGTQRVELEATCACFANSAGADEVKPGDVGSVVYAADDQTVAKTSDAGARPVAGEVVYVDSLGVWVAIGPRALGG